MKNTANALLVVATATLMSAGFAPSAQAATQRWHNVTATAACAAATGTDEASLTKSALGIVNKKSSNLTIVCSLPADVYTDSYVSSVYVGFKSYAATGTTPASISCTMLAGSRWTGTSSVTKTSAAISPNGTAQLVWNNIDLMIPWVTNSYGSFNFSCSLPNNFEIHTISVDERDSEGKI